MDFLQICDNNGLKVPTEKQKRWNNRPKHIIVDSNRSQRAKWISIEGMPKQGPFYHISYHRGIWYFLNRTKILAKLNNKHYFDFKFFLRWCKLYRDTLHIRKRYTYKVRPFDVTVQMFAAYNYAEQKEKEKNGYSEAFEHITYLELMRDIERRDKARERKRKEREPTKKRRKDPPPRAIKAIDIED